jgi:sec-independent protein translocase protein TatC
MVFAKLLRLRDKLSRKRQQLDFDEEKPFLEHLEDLRKTLTKIVLTLLICALGAMFWYKEFLGVVKLPAQKAGLDLIADPNRPKQYENLEDWERVKEVARRTAALSEAERKDYYAVLQQSSPDLVVQAQALNIYETANSFAPTKDKKGVERVPSAEELASRDAYVAKRVAGNVPLESAVKKLIELKTKPELEAAKPVIELVWRKPAESFFTAMKLSLYAGVVVAFPLIFYFILEFILPGLTQREKKLLWPALAVGFGLFLVGVTFAFLWVVPRTLEFFHIWSLDIDGTKDLWTFADYTSFVTTFTLVFGASFELPVVVLVLVKLGLLSTHLMRNTRSYAIVIITVVAAIITPTGDPGTLAALAVPMIVMYEACIWIGVWMEKKAAKAAALEEAEHEKERQAWAESRAKLALESPAGSVARSDDDDHQTDGKGTADDVSQAADDHYHHYDDYHREEKSRVNEPEHPQISGSDTSNPDAEHEAWLKEQEEIYRREHAHLFTDEETSDASENPEKKDESEEPKGPKS